MKGTNHEESQSILRICLSIISLNRGIHYLNVGDFTMNDIEILRCLFCISAYVMEIGGTEDNLYLWLRCGSCGKLSLIEENDDAQIQNHL